MANKWKSPKQEDIDSLMKPGGRFEIFRRGGIEPIANLGKTAWNLREWQREVIADPTLDSVLSSLLPSVRRELEITAIDIGLANQVSMLPGPEELTAAALIAFVEGLDLGSGVHIEIPPGKVPEGLEWKTLARKRAERIAMQWVNADTLKPQVDWQDSTQVSRLEKADINVLSKLWDACLEMDRPKKKDIVDDDVLTRLLSRAEAAKWLNNGIKPANPSDFIRTRIENNSLRKPQGEGRMKRYYLDDFPKQARDKIS